MTDNWVRMHPSPPTPLIPPPTSNFRTKTEPINKARPGPNSYDCQLLDTPKADQNTCKNKPIQSTSPPPPPPPISNCQMKTKPIDEQATDFQSYNHHLLDAPENIENNQMSH